MPLKPAWLNAFHAYLRARPIRRAVYWVIGCLLLCQLAHVLRGEPITLARFGGDLLAWSAGGVAFYVFMRWWDATHAR